MAEDTRASLPRPRPPLPRRDAICRDTIDAAVDGRWIANRDVACWAANRSTAVDCTRDAAAHHAVAGVLLAPLGAPADGSAGVRSAAPLVCRAGLGRSGVGPLDLLEEPRPAAGG